MKITVVGFVLVFLLGCSGDDDAPPSPTQCMRTCYDWQDRAPDITFVCEEGPNGCGAVPCGTFCHEAGACFFRCP